jgi:iron complex outermembrane receptor protein
MKMFKLCLIVCGVLISWNVNAQLYKVTGTVTSGDGEVLVGASVLEVGTSNGVITNVDGQFEISVQTLNSRLRVSYVGYADMEREINAQQKQDFKLESNLQLAQVNVVGSRNMNRSSVDTPAPVDIINIKDITSKQGQLDINQLLQFAAPSFNSNRQNGSDGSDHVDAASLRGLGPDQTLVLINGKRRHQSALVNLIGTRGRGNTGTDLNAIPAAAIERIEILRDGAAAQYGSDAIAGVINVVLKDRVNELTANINSGVYFAKYRPDDKVFDGLTYNANLNYGWKIAEKGFINLTADYNHKNHTNRAYAQPDEELVRREYGDPTQDNLALYYNGEVSVFKKFSIYSFGGVNRRQGDGYAWTRFKDDDRNIPSIYPNGFDPIVSSKIHDIASTVGIRGEWKSWNVDLSNTYGFNKFHFFVNNSLNTSFGPNSPTSFDAGGFQLGQNVVNFNASRLYKNIFEGLNIAFGAEYRNERYQIFEGEPSSWRNYDTSKLGGAQGFPGFSPANVLDRSRNNVGVYVDVEADVTKSLLVNAALRYENYSDFGNTLNGKIGLRYKITDDFILRGSASTGFRAPSLAQKFFNSTFTNFINGNSVEVLLAGNESEVTNVLGIPKLKQETSQNASIGLTYNPNATLSVTIDGYYVKVKDRVLLTGQFTDEDPQIGNLLRALSVGQAQFFTNALSHTTTTGIDVIVAHQMPLGTGKLRSSFAGNFNRMQLGSINTTPKLAGKEDIYFNERERRFVLASAPPSKMNLTFDYVVDRWNMMVRFVRFGEIKLANWNVGEVDSNGRPYTEQEYLDVYKPKVQTDVTVAYKLSNQVSLAVGASNIFNVYPNKFVPALTESGGAWDPVQLGTNGTFLFVRVGLKF